MINEIIIFISLVILSACNSRTNSDKTQRPTIADYQDGEKWVWKYKVVITEGEIRSEGEDTREIIRVDGVLEITIGNDTIPVTDIVKPDESETPKYHWPLEVGKNWKYENYWTSQDGTTGNQSQDNEILSYQ
jgi:hypothetical protein